MTNLEMVQHALAELGDASAGDLTAFVAAKYGTTIDPRFIPVYKASILCRHRRAAVLQNARAAARPVMKAPGRLVAPTSQRAGDARQLALQLMAAHGLHEWTFQFNRCKRALGLCVYQVRSIELSIHFVERGNSSEEIRDTILHEIAHALVGPGHGHDRIWKRMCIQIGARPMRCGHADMPEGRWQARCGQCGKSFQRHRKPKQARGWFCRGCGPVRGRLAWKQEARLDLAHRPFNVS